MLPALACSGQNASSIYAPDEPMLGQFVLVLFAGVAAAES